MSRGGVGAKNYVLHIDHNLIPGITMCGRNQRDVNRTTDPSSLTPDEGCRACEAAYRKIAAKARELSKGGGK